MYGWDPSEPATRAATEFLDAEVERVLELGGGQGRDTLFLASRGFRVHTLDFASAGVEAIRQNAAEAGLKDRVLATRHDVRDPLPVPPDTFDACFSHMLFSMALTTAELVALARDVLRVLRPGGLCVYTARNTHDPDFGVGVHHGEGLYEDEGFIVHFFDRAKVDLLAEGYEVLKVEEFEEGPLPRRLFRVVLRKPKTA
jgi:SAM-dependent methyltransferase